MDTIGILGWASKLASLDLMKMGSGFATSMFRPKPPTAANDSRWEGYYVSLPNDGKLVPGFEFAEVSLSSAPPV